MNLTKAERHFIRHALGLTRQRVGYRNYYAAGADDVALGRKLCAKGLAVEIPSVPSWPLIVTFLITRAGFDAVAERGESMNSEELARMRRIGAIEPCEAPR